MNHGAARTLVGIITVSTVFATISTGPAMAGPPTTTPDTVTISYDVGSSDSQVSATSVIGMVGDVLTIHNGYGATTVDITNGTGKVSKGGSDCTPATCDVGAGANAALTVTQLGTIVLTGGGLTARTILIAESSGNTSEPARTERDRQTLSFGLNGGACAPTPAPITVWQGEQATLPSTTGCTKSGHTPLGWSNTCTGAILPGVVDVVQSTTLCLVWKGKVPEAPTEVKATGGPESIKAAWKPTASSDGRPASTGYRASAYVAGSAAGVPATGSCSTDAAATECVIGYLQANVDYVVTVVAINSGGDSAPSQPSAPARTTAVAVATKTIIITSSGRTTVGGKPGVYADGMATGFAAGDTLKVWVKFPGQTSYTEGTARPAIASAGTFEWSRKTGKKTYVYFSNSDGQVKSSSVIIPAK